MEKQRLFHKLVEGVYLVCLITPREVLLHHIQRQIYPLPATQLPVPNECIFHITSGPGAAATAISL